MKTIEIYLTPDQKTTSCTEQEVADHIGISLAHYRDRVRVMGEDHYLTYFPGTIPTHLRRYKGARRHKSTLDAITVENRGKVISEENARLFVASLIKISKKHYEMSRCCESRDFLLNKTGMLEWYLEAYPKVDQEVIMQRLREWVMSLPPTVKKRRSISDASHCHSG